MCVSGINSRAMLGLVSVAKGLAFQIQIIVSRSLPKISQRESFANEVS